MRLGILGCGHMGSAMAQAIVKNRLGGLWITSRHKKKMPGCRWTRDNLLAVSKSEYIIIGVRPADVEGVLKEIRPALSERHVIIGVAAGVPLAKLIKWSGKHKKIVRSFPNLPAQVGCGVTVWKCAPGLNAGERRNISRLFRAFGKSVEVKNEALIDKAIISGCGPAFTAAFLESMARFAEKSGFTQEQARMIAKETVAGTLVYIDKTNVSFGGLKQAVQTKGGSTEAAFKILTKKKWQEILEQGCEAALK